MATPPKSPLSRRLDGVSESATLKLNAAVQTLKQQGVDVVNLTAGEPDFHVPDAAKEAVMDALKANRSKYTPVAGIPELRAAIAEKTNRQQPAAVSRFEPWKPADVIVTNGGKQAIYNAFMALLDPGDEVLIPTPYWLSYPEMVKLAGGIPKFVTAPFERGFKISPAQLRAAIGPRVKAVVFNSPSNPTGAMYSRDEFAALGRVLAETPGAEGIWVISDEIYDRIILGETPFCSFLQACPELRPRTITVNGMSKSAAMTGWRAGWSVAPLSVTSGMITLQGQSTSGVSALTQWASLAALRVPESAFAHQIESFRRRRDLTLEMLRKAGKIKVLAPEGAFYAFVGVGAFLRAGEDSISFVERLLDQAKVAVVPGTPFGDPEFVRISFATEERALVEGCRRMVAYLEA
jgi:aspartate/methionine/tyrosine aminotransferase